MQVTVKKISDDSAISGANVKVDGGSPVATDSSGNATVSSGQVIEVGLDAKVQMIGTYSQVDIWIEGSSGGMGCPMMPPTTGCTPTPGMGCPISPSPMGCPYNI